MAKVKVFKAPKSVNDNYQSARDTQYAKDQTTGKLYLTSGTNQRTIIPEQFKTAVFVGGEMDANNSRNTVYTVPAGKVLLLLGVTLQLSFQAASYGNQGQMYIAGIETLSGVGSDVAGAYAMSQNLNSILVLNEGELIEVATANVKIKATGCFFGYLIDKSEYYPASG